MSFALGISNLTGIVGCSQSDATLDKFRDERFEESHNSKEIFLPSATGAIY